MKVKAVDIAKKLNISKATVSLALNNKPGVSPQTREAIIQAAREMSWAAGTPAADTKKSVRLVIVDAKKRIVRNSENGALSDAMAVYDEECRKLGYNVSIAYTTLDPEDVERAVADANAEDVVGVILYATEITEEEFEPFRQIQKPMVVYDNEIRRYHCVAADHVPAVSGAVDFLVSRGCRDIRYLANKADIYNFRKRRAGYRAGLRRNGLILREDSIVPIGNLIDEVYRNALVYLDRNDLPDAFILENFQVSAGVLRAVYELGISVPEEVSMIGIDELPGYLSRDFQLTSVKISHEERAKVAMMFLEQEIRGGLPVPFKAFSECEIVPGNSIK